VFGSSERFEDSQKKGRPFRAAPLVLAAVRLHDSRPGCRSTLGHHPFVIANIGAGIVTAILIPAVNATDPPAPAGGFQGR
jgi:hypothetical protein